MKSIKHIFVIHTLIFLFAFFLNLIWEILHTQLYISTMNHNLFGYMYMGAVDGFLVLLIYWIVCLQTQTFFWLADLKKHFILILGSAVFLSFFIEVKNVYINHVWSYTSAMPIIPFLQVGLSPVLQMIVTTLLSFLFTILFCDV